MVPKNPSVEAYAPYGPLEFPVYEYRSGATVFCDGETSYVENLLKPDDFILPFGGWIASTDEVTGKGYFGVWGRRNAKRFRRLLRERGAHITIVRQDQPGRHPLRSETYPAAYHENRLARKRLRMSQDSQGKSADRNQK